jgi:hypothetical protein
MSQAMCELLVDKLINSDELGEITETIQVALNPDKVFGNY